MDRLVDLLWGEQAPKTATTSLQNGISQLRRELGADVVETRAPGYIVDVDPDTVDAVRFESMLTAARAAPAAERAELLRAALALWRGPPLADLGSEEWAQGEIRRLEDLRLTALEERIDADIELGLHREVTGELEALSAANPLRERVCALRMLALYRSGRQAEALQAFRDTRHAFVEQLGLEPGAELQELHAQILRQEAGLAPGRVSAAAEGVESELLAALLSGKVVPVLGLAGGAELARQLAGTFEVPEDVSRALSRVSQYVAAMRGAGPLHDELHERYRDTSDVAPRAPAAGASAVHPARARCPVPARRHDGVRPRRRAGVRGSGRGARRRHLRGRRRAARALRSLPARRGASHGRRPQRVRRALAGPADGAPAPSGRRRPEPGAHVGELRRHRRRPHRLPRGRRAGRGDPGHARRAPPAQSLPLHRLRPRRLEPAARDQPPPRRPLRPLCLVGGARGPDAARARVLAPPRRRRCSTWTRTPSSGSSRAVSTGRRRHEQRPAPLALQGPGALRGHAARRDAVLRPGARRRDRRGERRRVAADGAVRAERGRQVVPHRRGRGPRACVLSPSSPWWSCSRRGRTSRWPGWLAPSRTRPAWSRPATLAATVDRACELRGDVYLLARPGGGALPLPPGRPGARAGARGRARARAQGERAALPAGGRGGEARPLQGVDPRHPRQLPAPRPPVPRGSRGGRGGAARAVRRGGWRAGRDRAGARRRRARPGRDGADPRRSRRRRAGGRSRRRGTDRGSLSPARDGAALGGGARGRIGAHSASRRSIASAVRPASSPTTSSVRSPPCPPAGRRSPPASSGSS